ncbi:MAG: NAD(P)/FAD-dependent oxidoreductase [Alphaproteobacteria bacterium]|nr:NAD(P)/FAD-dependent oxidoreductase [Alphaproteobacteria bacterium]
MENSHVDVLIVGAGLSGVGAAYHLQKKCPGKSYAILEARQTMGGTWDLFRYPGIRSDSDMHTLGFNFKPWVEQKAIADGPAILKYINETAAENGIDQHIRYGNKVIRSSWDSEAARWTVEVEVDGKRQSLTCHVLHMCAGYYNYDKGYTPDFEGVSDFKGDIIHPQHWPEDLDYSGKKVVVIGSGATAMTLVPAMTDKAELVTMLQRSPTYVVSRPAEDKLANGLRKWLPNKLAYGLTRWRNVLFQLFFFNMARKRPEKVKENIIARVREELGPDYDVETHFTPTYNPWDQRLCLVPDSDLFNAIKSKKADVVTNHIDRFTAEGIKLKSGDILPADIIVTATGLDLQFAGGMEIAVDGRTLNPHDLINYKGCMLSDVPNMVVVFGYTNASWTLRADLTSEFMCRLVNYMDRENFVEARPVAAGVEANDDFLDFSSGYVQRAMQRFPKRGTRQPWVLNQNYAKDIMLMRHGKLDDEALVFRRAHESLAQLAPVAVAAE